METGIGTPVSLGSYVTLNAIYTTEFSYVLAAPDQYAMSWAEQPH